MVHFEEINQASPSTQYCSILESSNTEACAKTLLQILANNIDNGGRERDWSENLCEILCINNI